MSPAEKARAQAKAAQDQRERDKEDQARAKEEAEVKALQQAENDRFDAYNMARMWMKETLAAEQRRPDDWEIPTQRDDAHIERKGQIFTVTGVVKHDDHFAPIEKYQWVAVIEKGRDDQWRLKSAKLK